MSSGKHWNTDHHLQKATPCFAPRSQTSTWFGSEAHANGASLRMSWNKGYCCRVERPAFWAALLHVCHLPVSARLRWQSWRWWEVTPVGTVGGSATPRPPAREDVSSSWELQKISGQSCTATSGGLTSTKYLLSWVKDRLPACLSLSPKLSRARSGWQCLLGRNCGGMDWGFTLSMLVWTTDSYLAGEW